MLGISQLVGIVPSVIHIAHIDWNHAASVEWPPTLATVEELNARGGAGTAQVLSTYLKAASLFGVHAPSLAGPQAANHP